MPSSNFQPKKQPQRAAAKQARKIIRDSLINAQGEQGATTQAQKISNAVEKDDLTYKDNAPEAGPPEEYRSRTKARNNVRKQTTRKRREELQRE